MKPKTHVLPDRAVPCEICGKTFKTLQGLRGHCQLVHSPGAVGPSSVAPAAETGPSSVESSGGSAGPSSTVELRGLKAEVERLQLELKKRKLQGEFPAPVAESPDIMQRSGLGAFTNEAQVLAQRRALGVADQGPAQSWLDKLLANPESLKLGIDALKGILGVRDGQNDNLSGLLKDLGFNLKDLLLERAAPTAGEITIGGVSLAGAALTPQLLDSVMKYKAAEEKAKGDFESRKLMADSLDRAIVALVPAIADLQAGRQGGPGIQQQPRPGAGPEDIQAPQPQFAECPKCGQPIAIPAGFPGGQLRCQARLVDGSTCLGRIDLEIVADPEASTPGRRKKKAKPEPGASLKCAGCGQLIDISGKPLGSTVRCPICQAEFVITSDTESVPALEPLTDEEKRSSAWRDAFKQGD